MIGKYTMADLRKWLGWKTAAEYIRSRQLSYLGHLGRYSDQRIETRVLRSSIKLPEVEGMSLKGHHRPWKTQHSLHATIQRNVSDMCKTAFPDRPNMSTGEALQEWPELAKDRTKWRKAQAAILTKMRKADERDQWIYRHAEDLPEDERGRQMKEAVGEARRTGEWKCPHCQRVISQYGFRNHVKECTGGVETKKRVRAGTCRHCGVFFLALWKHEQRCLQMRIGSTETKRRIRTPKAADAAGRGEEGIAVADPPLPPPMQQPDQVPDEVFDNLFDDLFPPRSDPDTLFHDVFGDLFSDNDAEAAEREDLSSPDRPPPPPAPHEDRAGSSNDHVMPAVAVQPVRRTKKSTVAEGAASHLQPQAPPPPRPPQAPGTSSRKVLCSFCNTWQGENHRLLCDRAPFSLWAESVRATAQQGGREMLPAVTNFFCEFCVVGWHSQRAYSMHAQKCDKKRRARDLSTQRFFQPGMTPDRDFLLAQGVSERHLNRLFAQAEVNQ